MITLDITPDMEAELEQGARFVQYDDGVQLVSPNAVDALIDAKMAFCCGNPACGKLHLYDDTSWKEFFEIMYLVEEDGFEV